MWDGSQKGTKVNLSQHRQSVGGKSHQKERKPTDVDWTCAVWWWCVIMTIYVHWIVCLNSRELGTMGSQWMKLHWTSFLLLLLLYIGLRMGILRIFILHQHVFKFLPSSCWISFGEKEKKKTQKFLGWDATKVANHSSKCTKLDITVEMKVADVRWINNTFELFLDKKYYQPWLILKCILLNKYKSFVKKT